MFNLRQVATTQRQSKDVEIERKILGRAVFSELAHTMKDKNVPMT